MRFYGTITKIDAEQRMVWGYASTEAQDDQGEVVKREALDAALADYMRFANIREMHRNSAVGVATEAAVDERGLYLGARIVDDDAWEKVLAGVYKGFSIGGRVTARDPADRTIITGLALSEISVVDRPANPEAVFDCWKAARGARADNALMRRIQQAHDQLCDAGALCGGGAAPATAAAESETAAAKSAASGELAKAFIGEILPRLDALAKRVEAIAQTPLPPATIARHSLGLSKREDGGGLPVAADDIVAALARMSDEERTLVLIKAAHANPIRSG